MTTSAVSSTALPLASATPVALQPESPAAAAQANGVSTMASAGPAPTTPGADKEAKKQTFSQSIKARFQRISFKIKAFFTAIGKGIAAAFKKLTACCKRTTPADDSSSLTAKQLSKHSKQGLEETAVLLEDDDVTLMDADFDWAARANKPTTLPTTLAAPDGI